MSVSEPGKIITPWAESGLKNPIPPAANPATGRAGFDQGFSAINMTAKEAGGIPPFAQDFNGIFYEVTNILRYMQAGGQPTFDAALATAIGGYPKGAMVLGSDGVTLWQSKVDSNTDDPNSGSNKWILAVVQDVSTISDLRLTEPSRSGQLIGVTSYYGGWAAIDGGGPEFGGRFWHDSNDTTTPDNGFTCIVTAGGKRWKRVRGRYNIGHAGAVNDGFVTDSTAQVQQAVNAGGDIEIPEGEWLADRVIITQPTRIFGPGHIKLNMLRVKTSNFTLQVTGLVECRQYADDVNSARAVQVLAYEDGSDYENIKILFTNFKGFFYSSDLRAREYEADPSDPANRIVKNTLIMGCTSVAPSGVNAGHFQHCGITNAKTVACTTNGGANATSYNFINGNGYIIVDSCYDENNTYGSLEIENNRTSYAVVSACVFGKQLWIDDTSNVSISGCAVADRVLITAQSNDTDNITISGVTCTRLSVSEFGDDPIGRHKSVIATGCTFTGDVGSNDVFADDSVDSLTLESCQMNGIDSSAVAVIRSASCNHMIRNNKSRVARGLAISGAGGRVIEYGNDNMITTGASDSSHISAMMVPSKDYLDLPGKYLHGTKYTGSLAPGGSAIISLPIPDSGALAFRGVAVWVMIRDTEANAVSSFRLDALYRVVGGSVQISFGVKYSTIGVDAGDVSISNGSSTPSSINLSITNGSATKTLQITAMPEVSSKLGTEA